MAETLLIRPGTNVDLGDIDRLRRLWADEENTYGLRTPSPLRAGSWADGLLLVADSGTSVVGFALGSLHENANDAVGRGGRYAEVDELYVQSECRNSGIGGDLLDSLLQSAATRGISQFRVFSAAKDQHAIMRFYERHGFTPWGILFFR